MKCCYSEVAEINKKLEKLIKLCGSEEEFALLKILLENAQLEAIEQMKDRLN